MRKIAAITQAESILVIVVTAVDLLNWNPTIQVKATGNLGYSQNYLVGLKKQTTKATHQIKLILVIADTSPAISFFVLSSLR